MSATIIKIFKFYCKYIDKIKIIYRWFVSSLRLKFFFCINSLVKNLFVKINFCLDVLAGREVNWVDDFPLSFIFANDFDRLHCHHERIGIVQDEVWRCYRHTICLHHQQQESRGNWIKSFLEAGYPKSGASPNSKISGHSEVMWGRGRRLAGGPRSLRNTWSRRVFYSTRRTRLGEVDNRSVWYRGEVQRWRGCLV